MQKKRLELTGLSRAGPRKGLWPVDAFEGTARRAFGGVRALMLRRTLARKGWSNGADRVTARRRKPVSPGWMFGEAVGYHAMLEDTIVAGSVPATGFDCGQQPADLAVAASAEIEYAASLTSPSC